MKKFEILLSPSIFFSVFGMQYTTLNRTNSLLCDIIEIWGKGCELLKFDETWFYNIIDQHLEFFFSVVTISLSY